MIRWDPADTASAQGGTSSRSTVPGSGVGAVADDDRRDEHGVAAGAHMRATVVRLLLSPS